MIQCFKCPKGMATGHSLYRVNQKGVPGIWACEDHRIEKDEELEKIVHAIEGGELPPNESKSRLV